MRAYTGVFEKTVEMTTFPPCTRPLRTDLSRFGFPPKTTPPEYERSTWAYDSRTSDIPIMFVRIKRIAKRRRKELCGHKRPGRTRSVTVAGTFYFFSFATRRTSKRIRAIRPFSCCRYWGSVARTRRVGSPGVYTIDTVFDTRRNRALDAFGPLFRSQRFLCFLLLDIDNANPYISTHVD